MALEKAVISNVDTGEDIQVMFNPKEYVMEKKTPWSEVNVFGMDSPPVQFTMGERKRLSMELFFDTSEEKTDVREHTGKIEELMMVNAQEHRPPLLRFSWGSLSFDCVLEDLVQRYRQFLRLFLKNMLLRLHSYPIHGGNRQTIQKEWLCGKVRH